MALDQGGAGGNSPNKKRQKDYNDLLKDKLGYPKPKNQGGQPQRQGAQQRNQRRRRRTTARQGDTLNTIADKAGVHADEMARANPGVDKVRPGMVLNIPNAPAGPQTQGREGQGGFFGGVTAQAYQQKRAERTSQDMMRGRGYRRNQGTTSQIPQGAGYTPPTPQRGYGPPNPTALRIGDMLKKGNYGGYKGKSEEEDKLMAERAMGFAARYRKQVRERGGNIDFIGSTYGPFVPFGPPGPNGEAPVAPFATYNEPIAQGDGVFGSYVLEDVFNAGGLPVTMSTNQANTLGLDPELLAEAYYIDEWGNWKLLPQAEEQQEQPVAYGGGGYPGWGGGGWGGFGGGGGGGRSLGASPDWLSNSPFDNGLTSWSIR